MFGITETSKKWQNIAVPIPFMSKQPMSPPNPMVPSVDKPTSMLEMNIWITSWLGSRLVQ